MGTGLGSAGAAVYATPLHGYPLPPPIPGRRNPVFNGNGQYVLPHPDTGKPTSFTRASTVAKALEDTYMLNGWQQRMMLLGILEDSSQLTRLDKVVTTSLAKAGLGWDTPKTTLARELRSLLNSASEDCQQAAGSKAAAEFGTATHAWCEWVDHGLGRISDVPEIYRPWVAAHRRILAENGLTADPDWTERIVLNATYGIAGTLDRLFWTHDRQLFLGDIKTSRGMDYSWLYFAIQLAIYHGATHMLSLDGKRWEPMPELDPHTALVAHLPREAPEKARIVPINMEFGRQALYTAVAVRHLRTQADKTAQSVLYTVGSLTTEVRRYYAARLELELSRTEAEMAAVWERYQDVWDDDLTAIGRTSLRSAHANANA